MRIALVAYAAVVVWGFGSDIARSRGLLALWDSWDAPHYLGIAQYGYGPAHDQFEIAFFPLLPAIIRIGAVVLPPLLVGMLVSFVASLLAAIGLHRLVSLDADRATARRAVLWMNLFPTSFALVPPYSEPLFLALVVWAYLAARRDGWWRSGVLGALASMARLQGALLAPTLLVEYLASHGSRVDRRILSMAIVPVGTLVYLGVNLVAFSDPFYFLDVQSQHFFHSAASPLEVIGGLVNGVTSHVLDTYGITVYLAPLVSFVILGLVVVWTLRSRLSRPSYAAYAVLTFASLSTLTWPISVPRYLLGVAPMFVALAEVTRRRVIAIPLFAISCALLGFFAALFALGQWAF